MVQNVWPDMPGIEWIREELKSQRPPLVIRVAFETVAADARGPI
jgi:hypothetical protein